MILNTSIYNRNKDTDHHTHYEIYIIITQI